MDLVAELTHRCDEVIESELTRLGRRQPGLSPADLVVIEQALSDLADKLLLDALRHKPALIGRVEPLLRAAAHPCSTENGSSRVAVSS
jgi:hypothetical protein